MMSHIPQWRLISEVVDFAKGELALPTDAGGR